MNLKTSVLILAGAIWLGLSVPAWAEDAAITEADGKLFLEKTKGQAVELFPEATDLFFRRDVEGRILFHFGADGKVDRLIDRRNNEDVTWKKIG